MTEKSDEKNTVQVEIDDFEGQMRQLVGRAAQGETVIIAQAGKPLAKVMRAETSKTSRRIGFMKGEISVPDDFDEMGKLETEDLFLGDG